MGWKREAVVVVAVTETAIDVTALRAEALLVNVGSAMTTQADRAAPLTLSAQMRP